MIGRLRFTLVLAALLPALLAPAVAAAQQPTESPTPAECLPGALCLPGNEPVDTRGPRGPVIDPPGNHVRSLATMAAIALVVGAYLFVALTGRSVRLRPRRVLSGRG